MDLYFLRHGDALGKEEWKGDDNARALSDEGVARMAREAKTLAGLSLGISLILSSPLVRAVKTAEIVAAALGLRDSLLTDKRLSPGFDLPALREILSDHAEVGALMLVGHEPDFSETIAACIGGGRVECKKGGLARLDITDPLRPRGSLLWLLPPRVLAP
ncbi:MAG: phosphohistidine phosphatase SixA [Spirochaetia bacterium]